MTLDMMHAEATVRDATASLLAALTARDQAVHHGGLVQARNIAAELAADAATAVADLERKVKAASAVKVLKFAAEAEKAVTVLEARKLAATTPAGKTEIEMTLTAARTTAAEAVQAAAPEAERVRQLSAEMAGADARLTDLRAALAGAEAAVDSAGRAPVSSATLELIGAWWAAWPAIPGLPELTVAEQQDRHGHAMRVAASGRIKADYVVPNLAEYRTDPRFVGGHV
jgi:hypothetical protein